MKLLVSAIALSIFAITPVLAAQQVKTPSKGNPWFVQVSFGVITNTDSGEQALADLRELGHDVKVLNFETSNESYQIELGYQMTPNWAVAAGYVDFGPTEFNVNIETTNADLLIDDISATAPRYGSGNTFSLIYNYHIIPDLVLSIDAGVLLLESEYNAKVNIGTSQTPVYYQQTVSDSSVQWFTSAGLSYFYKGIEAGIYYRHYEIDHVNSEWLGLRLGYHF
ncbi:MAG: hypothetical protein ACI9U5_002129 [Colwellia sp.]|jgi:hypothetical protein